MRRLEFEKSCFFFFELMCIVEVFPFS